MRGVYQHCAKRHLHRYLAEFDFRYSNRVALGIGDVPRAADEDEAQRRRFIETAKALEADGELNLTDGEGVFERLVDRALPPRKPRP